MHKNYKLSILFPFFSIWYVTESFLNNYYDTL